MPDVSSPWLMFMHELKSYLSGGVPDDPAYGGLQVLPTPQEALWDDPVLRSYYERKWCDMMPDWGLTYLAEANKFFSVAYGLQFLNSLKVTDPDPALNLALEESGKALQQQSQKILALRLQAGRDWKDFDEQQQELLPASEWVEFDEWYQTSGYVDESAAMDQARLNLLGQFAADSERAVDPDAALVGFAIREYQNDQAYWGLVTDPLGGKVPWPKWNLSPDLRTWIQEAAANQGQSIDLTISSTTSTTTSSSYEVGGAVGFGIGFFGFGAQGGYEHETIDTSTDEFSMSFKSSAFSGFSVEPGGWYNGNVVSRFKDGPFKPGYSGADFFGPDGDMNLLPSTVYLAYKPTITMKLTEHDYHMVKDKWNAKLGIVIGPFAFGGKGNGENDTATTDDATRSITVIGNSPHPTVVAVLNKVLP